MTSNDFDKTPKAWILRVVYGTVSLWLAFVAAAATIKTMSYIAFVALPLWNSGFEMIFHEARFYMEMYSVTIYLFVWLLFSVGYIKGLGNALWRYGRFTNDCVRYPITAVGLTILSSMLDTGKQMHPGAFLVLVSIADCAYLFIRTISSKIKI
jgi:hypothetical protein